MIDRFPPLDPFTQNFDKYVLISSCSTTTRIYFQMLKSQKLGVIMPSLKSDLKSDIVQVGTGMYPALHWSIGLLSDVGIQFCLSSLFCSAWCIFSFV